MGASATANPDAADYAVVGAPLDASTSFRPGARFGPGLIREFSDHFEPYDHHTGLRFSDLGVTDHGDIYPSADIEEYLTFLESVLREYHEDGTVPLLLGGEHTVTIAGVRATEPDVYVCLDAHLDLRESYRGDPLSHATVTHHALRVADETVVLGARSGTEAEFERAETGDVTLVAPEAVSDWEPPAGKRLYCSVDIDAADPGFAPGTGTPEPFGLDPHTMHDIVRGVAPQTIGFDVVEVNDRDDGQAPALGAKLLRAFVYAHAAETSR